MRLYSKMKSRRCLSLQNCIIEEPRASFHWKKITRLFNSSSFFTQKLGDTVTKSNFKSPAIDQLWKTGSSVNFTFKNEKAYRRAILKYRTLDLLIPSFISVVTVFRAGHVWKSLSCSQLTASDQWDELHAGKTFVPLSAEIILRRRTIQRTMSHITNSI